METGILQAFVVRPRQNSSRSQHGLLGEENSLKGIDSFLDEDFAKNFLSKIPELGLTQSKILECETTPLKPIGKKGAVLSFRLSVSRPGSSSISQIWVVGKFKESQRNKMAFDVISELWANGFGDQNHLRVCQPIAYVEDWNLMLTSRASGIDLMQLLAAGHESLPSGITQAAQWLAQLHRRRIAWLRTRPIQKEEEKSEEIYKKFKKKHPSQSQRGRRITEQIIKRLGSVERESFTLTHGDYLMENILSDGSNLTVIDFGASCTFDPAKDLGKFLGHLAVNGRLYGRNLNTEALRERLLKNYSQEISTQFSERIAAYETRAYLKSLVDQSDPDTSLYWLQRAEERLRG